MVSMNYFRIRDMARQRTVTRMVYWLRWTLNWRDLFNNLCTMSVSGAHGG